MKNSLKETCTLLVNSCDSYSDCWDGFFQLLKIQWPECPFPIVLNTEHKDYAFDGLPIRVLNQIGLKKQAWGRRLIDALNRIDTKYVLFTLEDYYLDAPVDEVAVVRCLQWMEADPNIASFSFLPTDDENNVVSERYVPFEKRSQTGAYRMNCQIALWRRDLLLQCLRSHESPWEWELYGSRRSRRFHFELYTQIEGSAKIFSYQNGGVLSRGKWWMAHLQPLLERYPLDVDLSGRQTLEEFQAFPHKRKRSLLRGMKNRINKIRSLI